MAVPRTPRFSLGFVLGTLLSVAGVCAQIGSQTSPGPSTPLLNATWTPQGLQLAPGLTLSATGVLASQYLGTTPSVPLTLAGDVVLAKTTQAGVGPGAGALTLRVRPGSTPGTCKLVAAAGSAAQEVTIIDNVGASC